MYLKSPIRLRAAIPKNNNFIKPPSLLPSSSPIGVGLGKLSLLLSAPESPGVGCISLSTLFSSFGIYLCDSSHIS